MRQLSGVDKLESWLLSGIIWIWHCGKRERRKKGRIKLESWISDAIFTGARFWRSDFEQKLCPNLATLCCDILKSCDPLLEGSCKNSFQNKRVRHKKMSAVVMQLCVKLFSFHRMITKKMTTDFGSRPSCQIQSHSNFCCLSSWI